MPLELSADAYVALMALRRHGGPLFPNRTEPSGPDFSDVRAPGPHTVAYSAWADFAAVGELLSHGLVRHEPVDGRDALMLTEHGMTAKAEPVSRGGVGIPALLDLSCQLTGPDGRRGISEETAREITAIEGSIWRGHATADLLIGGGA